MRTDRELAHDGVVGREGVKGSLLDLNADVCDARVGRGADLLVAAGAKRLVFVLTAVVDAGQDDDADKRGGGPPGPPPLRQGM